VKIATWDFMETFVKKVIMKENILLKKIRKKYIFQTANVVVERMAMIATSQQVYVELVRREFLEIFVIRVIIINKN
jgi:hypothetical protein